MSTNTVVTNQARFKSISIKSKMILKHNIMAAQLIVEMLKTSLGPKGLGKILMDQGGDVVVTSSGFTILKELSDSKELLHPIAKIMGDSTKAIYNEVGDGTISTIVILGSLLKGAEELLDKGVHPTIIVSGYKKATQKALKLLNEASQFIPVDYEWLKRVIHTCISTTLFSKYSILSELISEATQLIADNLNGKFKIDIDNVAIKRMAGGTLSDSTLVKGVLIDKSVIHPGMPKRVSNACVALLNSPIEVRKTEWDPRAILSSLNQRQILIDEKKKMMRDIVNKFVDLGVNVILCRKGIDNVAQEYLARVGILAVKDVLPEDMNRLARATGGKIVADFNNMNKDDLGFADLVEERKFRGLFYEEKWVFVEGCKNPKAVTILLRASSYRIANEAERVVRAALIVAKNLLENPYVVFGGGAIETYLAQKLRSWSYTIAGKEQLAIQKFCDALESIPMTIAQNSGMNPIDIISELRMKHNEGYNWFGIDAIKRELVDVRACNIYEPLVVKEQVIKSATDVASIILRTDLILEAKELKKPPKPLTPPKKEEEEEEKIEEFHEVVL